MPPSPHSAAPSWEVPEDLLNLMLSQYQQQYKELVRKRFLDLDEVRLEERIRALQDKRQLQADWICDVLRRYYGEVGVLLLFYFYEKGTLHIWALDGEGPQGHWPVSIPKDQLLGFPERLQLAMGVEALAADRAPRRRGLRRLAPDSPAEDPRELISRLSAILFPPDLAGKLSAYRHLIIVPTLNLGTLPFALLHLDQEGRELIDACSLSLAPSLLDVVLPLEQRLQRPALMRLSQNRLRSGGPAYRFTQPLVVGNPDFPEDDAFVLPPLPGAEAEAKAVAALLKDKDLLTGKKAVKARVAQLAAEADLLYFATHGLADEEAPLDKSSLVFARTGSADPDSYLWTAREIQEARFRAELAVLSACQTGLGGTHEAGIIGLARSFQLAGVPHVVMSLWSVSDRETSLLMQDFVSALQRPHLLQPSEALREAMLALRKERPEPVYWSPFVVFGAPF